MIVKVLINTSVSKLNKVYDYKVPVELESKIELGKRVEVSFGRKKDLEEAIIVKVIEDEKYVPKYKLKEIYSVIDEISYIDENRLKLAKNIAYLYFCNVYDALKLMLPPGTGSKKSSKKIDGKKETAVRLIVDAEKINQDIDDGIVSSAKHIRLLTFLMSNDFVLLSDIINGLDISRDIVNTVVKKGYIELYKVEKEIDLLDELNVNKTYPMSPTHEQKNAIDIIKGKLYDEKYDECLLFGVTGSGKTEVYLQVIETVLSQGRKVIVLVPEISLTYQTVERFVSRFGNNVAILHSRMTIAKRKEEYKRIKEGKVDIVVGARSAIFAPIDNLGMVIIDEEHDSSYYSGSTPKYSTKEIARYICKNNNALLLLGSATPEVTTFYKAKSGNISLLTLKNRAGNAKLPSIELIDIKEDRLLGNTSVLPIKLKEEILQNIKLGQQTMIFLNRRGYTSYLTCKDCGKVFKCPNCDVAMTYHKKSNLLLCHYCSHVEKNITTCYNCGSTNISSGTIGTQKIEEELREIYPQISILRMDADTTVSRNAQQDILDKFKKNNVNVLVGTQMISKGHDISNVTLVGILGVDNMLAMNDYMASEKAYSNISQVAGRAGRGDLSGRVIIPTSDLNNYILNAVIKGDYTEFYEKEIEYRKMFNYPPFTDIVLFELSSSNFSIVKSESERLYNILNDSLAKYKVFSPKSPFVRRINNKYRINVLVKAKLNKEVYSQIYEKINIFNKNKNKQLNFVVTKNPTSIS